ncbi:zona pellucida glycoprotein d [Carcharodon carcharias]|uniref:zona pellucida glycoprotein d n=1 Tax=Carcharodon carcharias TaxID=13397 RepID=UPI001B7F2613|nr:zona pellucida glycoprotein d [Carcharodon carcharias]XP_041071719.1 zona pellucida glycoprotein d [Carcharodon carcharias]XP_041071720.1 zona pellucida glycoprotein d [Carcharodon carcharias]
MILTCRPWAVHSSGMMRMNVQMLLLMTAQWNQTASILLIHSRASVTKDTLKPLIQGELVEINETHKIFKHVITNEFRSDSSIIREEPLIFEVNCAYLRSSLVKMSLEVPPLIRMFKPVVQYNKENLHLTMSLYKNGTFTPEAAYGASPAMWLNDDLYLEVKAPGSFEAAFVLQVTSCWATTTPDPQGKQKFHFLQDGCPHDETFRWHSVNGASSSSRFSIKMFNFVERANHRIYLHCQTKICHIGTADCLAECADAQIPKRLEWDVLATASKPVNGIVSIGPIELWSVIEGVLIDLGHATTNWEDLKVLLWAAGGIIGTTLMVVVVVVVKKKIMIYNTLSQHSNNRQLNL